MGDKPAANQSLGAGAADHRRHSLHICSAKVTKSDIPGYCIGCFCHRFHLPLPRHDLAKIIGDEGEAKTDTFNEGSVQIESELWSARSAVPISEGSKVRVISREGFILEVETVPPANK